MAAVTVDAAPHLKSQHFDMLWNRNSSKCGENHVYAVVFSGLRITKSQTKLWTSNNVFQSLGHNPPVRF